MRTPIVNIADSVRRGHSGHSGHIDAMQTPRSSRELKACMAKRKRPDVSARKKRRKAQRLSTITHGMSPVTNEDLRNHIDACVAEASRAVVLACWLLNLAFSLKRPDDQLEINQSACYSAISLVTTSQFSLSGKARKQEFLKSVFVDHFLPLFPATFHWPSLSAAGGNVGETLAREMADSYQNYLDSALDAHAIKYLQRVCEVPRWEACQAWETDASATPTHVETVATELKALLDATGPVEFHRRLLEEIHLEDGKVTDPDAPKFKKFSLFPLRSIQLHPICVDAVFLRTWRPDSDVTVESFFPRRNGWEPVAEFKTDGVRTFFTYGKEPDGIPRTVTSARENEATGINLASQTKGLFYLEQLAPAPLDNLSYEAFDPGVTALYTGSNGTTLTRKEWELRKGTTRHLQALAHRKKLHGIDQVEARLSTASLKTSNPDVLKANIKVWIAEWDAMWDFYESRRMARGRFGLQIRDQRSLDYVANTVLGPDHSKVAVFGDCFFGAATKSLPPTPSKKLREYLARKGRVVLVGENMTTQGCFNCHQRMVRHKAIYSVFHCKNGCKTTWNRDNNASLNIEFCFKEYMAGRPRPEYLCCHRGEDDTETRTLHCVVVIPVI